MRRQLGDAGVNMRMEEEATVSEGASSCEPEGGKRGMEAEGSVGLALGATGESSDTRDEGDVEEYQRALEALDL